MPNPFNPDSLEKDPPIIPPRASCCICGGTSHEMEQVNGKVLCTECAIEARDLMAMGCGIDV